MEIMEEISDASLTMVVVFVLLPILSFCIYIAVDATKTTNRIIKDIDDRCESRRAALKKLRDDLDKTNKKFEQYY